MEVKWNRPRCVWNLSAACVRRKQWKTCVPCSDSLQGCVLMCSFRTDVWTLCVNSGGWRVGDRSPFQWELEGANCVDGPVLKASGSRRADRLQSERHASVGLVVY